VEHVAHLGDRADVPAADVSVEVHCTVEQRLHGFDVADVPLGDSRVVERGEIEQVTGVLDRARQGVRDADLVLHPGEEAEEGGEAEITERLNRDELNVRVMPGKTTEFGQPISAAGAGADGDGVGTTGRVIAGEDEGSGVVQQWWSGGGWCGGRRGERGGGEGVGKLFTRNEGDGGCGARGGQHEKVTVAVGVTACAQRVGVVDPGRNENSPEGVRRGPVGAAAETVAGVTTVEEPGQTRRGDAVRELFAGHNDEVRQPGERTVADLTGDLNSGVVAVQRCGSGRRRRGAARSATRPPVRLSTFETAGASLGLCVHAMSSGGTSVQAQHLSGGERLREFSNLVMYRIRAVDGGPKVELTGSAWIG
jgi:hypothetical protein